MTFKKLLLALIPILLLLFIFRNAILRAIPFSTFKTLPPEHVISAMPRAFQQIVDKQQAPTVFTNVSIIPMNADTVLKDQTVMIREGRIREIFGAEDSVLIPVPAKIYDAKGQFMIPGLADMHIHLNDDNNLLLLLANGVTTARNMASVRFHNKLRGQLSDKEILGPKLYTASPILEGPHQIWRNTDGSVRLESVDSARLFVHRFADEGYDFLKVYHTLAPEFYEAILEEADKIGIPVVGHMPLEVTIDRMLSLNQSSIEHIEVGQLRKISPEIELETKAEMIGASGKWICPTLIVFKKMNGKPGEADLHQSYEEYIDPRTKMFWMRRLSDRPNEYELRKQIAKIIYDNGGKFLAGTDALNAYVLHGFSLHEELEAYVSIGLSPFEALQTATVNPAVYLGIETDFGTIEVGKKAEFVLLAENPLADIRNTKKIQGVMFDGHWLDRAILDDIFKQVKACY